MTGSIESRPNALSPASLVELIHPRGICERVFPPDLVPAKSSPISRQYDWMMFDSPAHADRGWLRNALARAASSLDRDGVLWLELPRRLRPGIAAATFDAGLEIRETYALFADPLGLKAAVPLRLIGSLDAGFAGRRVLARQLASGALRLPGVLRVFELSYASVAFAIGRPGGRPLFDWLLPAKTVHETASVLLRRSWHRPDLVIAHIFNDDPPQLTAIAKIPTTPEGQSCVAAQEAPLRLVGSGAAGWGVETPGIVDPQPVARPALVTNAIRGRLAAGILERRPSEFRPLIQRIALWLAGWNEATKTSPSDCASRDVIAAAETLTRHIQDSPQYFAWLGELCRESASISRVASHGDLTMWNVVVSGDCIGVLDWEEASFGDLPLCDLYYALADGLAATSSYRDRVHAFNACFFGPKRNETKQLVTNLAQGLGIRSQGIQLSFHLCWLRHAANEVRRNPSAQPGPFLQIVRQLTQAHSPIW